MKAWILSDGAAGNESQALALAAALALDVEVKRLSASWPARWTAPRMGRLEQLRDVAGGPLVRPWPDLAIGCGRLAALATRRLREHGVRVAQILDPRIDTSAFDAVIAPAHDGLRGTNVVTTLGALNAVDDAWLGAARQRFADLGAADAPRTAVLVGGPTRHLPWARRDLEQMIVILQHWQARDGGSQMFSMSRRTPSWAVRRLRQAFADSAALFHVPAEGQTNPYAGMLAWAARIVVTGDSVNMISEACAVGVPVLYHAPRPARGRLGAFHRGLLEAGYIRPLRLEYGARAATPLREMDAVSARVAALLGLAPGNNESRLGATA